LLPDYHAYRGSYGGYAFPLYDRRPRINGPNLSAALIESLSAAYGQPIAPEDVFDSILCLLSARSYARRFAEDLEDVFPHVPFPARHAVFEDAVRIGHEIRAIETFGREPREAYCRPRFVRVVTQPSGAVAPIDYTDGVYYFVRRRDRPHHGNPRGGLELFGQRLTPRAAMDRVACRVAGRSESRSRIARHLLTDCRAD